MDSQGMDVYDDILFFRLVMFLAGVVEYNLKEINMIMVYYIWYMAII